MIEDQALLSESLRTMLELEREIEVVGEAKDAEQGLRELETLDIDVVLMNIRLPSMDGVEATRLLTMRHESPPVVMLTSYNDEYLEAALEAGATGYVLKSSSREELVQAVRTASQGQVVLSPSLTTSLIRELVDLRKAYRESLLSSRQLEILKLLAGGARTNEICSTLFISERTVYREIRKICDRLGAADVAHAVSEAHH